MIIRIFIFLVFLFPTSIWAEVVTLERLGLRVEATELPSGLYDTFTRIVAVQEGGPAWHADLAAGDVMRNTIRQMVDEHDRIARRIDQGGVAGGVRLHVVNEPEAELEIHPVSRVVVGATTSQVWLDVVDFEGGQWFDDGMRLSERPRAGEEPAVAVFEVDPAPAPTDHGAALADPHLAANQRRLDHFPQPVPEHPSVNWITARLAEPGANDVSEHEVEIRWANLPIPGHRGGWVYPITALLESRTLPDRAAVEGIYIDGNTVSIGYERSELTMLAGVQCFRSASLGDILQSRLISSDTCLNLVWVRNFPYLMLATVSTTGSGPPSFVAVAYVAEGGQAFFNTDRDDLGLPASLHRPFDFSTAERLELPFGVVEHALVRLHAHIYANDRTNERASVEDRGDFWRLRTPPGGGDGGHFADFFLDESRIACFQHQEGARCIMQYGWRESGRPANLAAMESREFRFSQWDILFQQNPDGSLNPAGQFRDGALLRFGFSREQP
jgi:hypothetical protein